MRILKVFSLALALFAGGILADEQAASGLICWGALGAFESICTTTPDGVRITFNPNGTNAGLNAGAHTADPSSPSNGDLFYNSTSNQLRARINGAWVELGGSAGNIQTLLDGISTTQGVIIYYNGTDWVALSPGTSGHFLQTQGASANPQWAAASGGTGDLLDWQYVEKTADEMVESSVTLQNDDHLVLALGTNQTWRLTMHLFMTTENNNEAPDFLGGWTLPSGATISFSQNCMSNSATGVGSHAPFFASNYQSGGGSSGMLCGILSTVDTSASPLFVEGIVKTGGTSGNLQLQWAQNSSNADGTIVKAESNMFMRRTQ